jgi:hypothetical protein
MTDNFQSKAAVKIPRAAKTVMVKTKSNATDMVEASTINETALSFIRAYKKSRPKQE